MNAKRIFALLLSVLMVVTCFAGMLTVSAEEDKFAPTNEEPVDLHDGSNGGVLGNFAKGNSFGVKVTIESGKRLTQVNFPTLATYNTNINTIAFRVYQWDTDYATTVAGQILGQTIIINHVDNAPLDVIMPTNRNMTGEILITATYVDGASSMTPVVSTGNALDGVQFFSNSTKCGPIAMSITVGDELTVQPASYTATFVADGNEIAKVEFLEGDKIIDNVPEVPAKEGFWADWESYTLGNEDITINAVYTDASGAIKPGIPDASHMTAFAEDHLAYLRGEGCAVRVNRDGTVSFVGTWAEDGDIDAYATINYLQMMQKHYESWNGRSSIPNKSHKYNVVAVKVKAPAVSLDATPTMTVTVGRDIEIYGIEVANAIKCDGNEEYWIFDFTDEKEFSSDIIQNMKINWAFSIGEESNLGAEFLLMGFQLFDSMDDALAATGGVEATEPPTEEPTEPATEEVTEAPTQAPTTQAPTTQTAPKEEGCSSVVGFGAVAVLAAAAAVVALKKKD